MTYFLTFTALSEMSALGAMSESGISAEGHRFIFRISWNSKTAKLPYTATSGARSVSRSEVETTN